MANTDKNKKNGWDTRAWKIGLTLGSLGPILAIILSFDKISDILETGKFLGIQPLLFVNRAILITFGVILPGVLSGIAKRRTFLWGLLPSILLMPTILILRAINGSSYMTNREIMQMGLSFTVSWLVASGAVSMFRYVRALQRRSREAALTAFAEQASSTQEGVWPPPPDYKS